MRSLSRADAIRLEAAEGWLELGNGKGADQELAYISPNFHAHPDVLEVRWQIYAKAKRWEDSLVIA